MAITVEWLLNLDFEDGFHIIAGDTSELQAITAVNMIDNPDTIPWLNPGSLVLSTGYLLSNESISKNLIRDLKTKGCSGLAIKMNRYLESISQAMIDQAEEYHFPIISVPYDSNMGQIISMVYEKLIHDDIDDSVKYSILYREISEAIYRQQKLSVVMQTIATSLESNIFLTNGSFELLEYALYSDSLTPHSLNLTTNTLFNEIDAAIIIEKADKVSPLFIHEILNSEAHEKYAIIPLYNKTALLGYFVVMLDSELTPNLLNFLISTSSIFSMLLINQSYLMEAENSSHNIFFNKLLSGAYKAEEEIDALCIKNNFDLKRERTCIAINIPEYISYTLAKRRPFEKKIHTIIQDLFNAKNIAYATTVYQTNFILFVYMNDCQNQHEYSEVSGEISQMLYDALKENEISCYIGYSKTYHGSLTIEQCYKQAMAALNIGHNMHKDQDIYSYYEDNVYHDLIDHHTNKELTEIYNDALGILEDFDKKNESSLVLTLQTYLSTHQSVSKSASELFIHRNTMFYRLEQIKKLLSIDFDNIDDLYRLYTALYIKQILTIFS